MPNDLAEGAHHHLSDGLCVQVEFADMYTERNVAISGIHTHSGPGGYLQYVLYDITSLGFVEQSWEAVVSGIVEVGLQGPL